MSVGPTRWRQRRRSAEARRPLPVVRRAAVRRRWRGGYQVTIEGTDLLRIGVMPEVRVGGREVRLVVVTPTRLTGVATARPSSGEMVVDNGAARTLTTVAVRPYPALPGPGELGELVRAWARRARAGRGR